MLSSPAVSSGESTGRFPSLDGLRAFAIGVVLLEHLAGTPRFPIGSRDFWPFVDVGYLGVRLFFVLSGFLITSLLVREHGKTGTVAVGTFYIRRAFRILPAFLVYVGLVALAAGLGQVRLRDGDLLAALTYTTNFHYTRSWELGHLWSLSVEEQFYFLWPAAIYFLGPRRLGGFALAAVASAPAIRVLAWYFAPSRDDVILEAFPCVMDSIATGTLLAVFRPQLDRLGWYQAFLRSRAFVLVPLLVCAAALETRVAIEYVVDPTVQNIAFALIVDRVVRVREGLTFRVLNSSPIVWVGTLSYSLYLWQEPFLNPKSHRWFATWPLNLALAFACATVSHYAVERPFFTARAAWERRRAAAAAAAAAAHRTAVT
jgi:peptidoglycan/LPS O-acetylase OafA/YrhL